MLCAEFEHRLKPNNAEHFSMNHTLQYRKFVKCVDNTQEQKCFVAVKFTENR